MTDKALTRHDWDTLALPDNRRVPLEKGISYDEIVDRIAEEAEIVRCWPEPYRHPPEDAVGARHIRYRIAVPPETFDLFYNSANGLRAMYWRSPTDGNQATRSAIERLKPRLLQFAEEHPEALACGDIEMGISEVQKSLDAPSAKTWVRETDDSENTMISGEDQPQLQVPRWAANESELDNKGKQWRWTPVGKHLEVKGALIGLDGTERVPPLNHYRLTPAGLSACCSIY